MQVNDTLVIHNAFLPNRQPGSLNISPEITSSPSKFRMRKYPQELCTRPPGTKLKPSRNSCKRTFQQGRSEVLTLLALHLFYLYARRMDPLDSVSITESSTVLLYPTNTPYTASGNSLLRQAAESDLQDWIYSIGTT